jgi:hypothetical protein
MATPHPLEHLSLETIEYISSRLSGSWTRIDPQRESLFNRVRQRLGTEPLRRAVRDVLG